VSCIAKARAGFTLVEVVAVLALMSLLMAIITVSLRPTLQRASFAQAVDLIAKRLTEERVKCRTQQQGGRVTFGLDQQVVSIQRENSVTPSQLVQLGKGVRITEVRFSDGYVNDGEHRFDITSRGRCETFSLQLESAHEIRWLLFSGVGLDVSVHTDEAEIEAIFQSLQTGWVDVY
jgi:prepilin-type N-terminal cleavage/methylation domain-containing protein